MSVDVRHIVEELAREMIALTVKTKAPRLLFIFCDSYAHEAYCDQFIWLDTKGIEYDLAFLDGITSAWLGMSKIESCGSGNCIAVDEYAPAPMELPKNYDGVIIPEIDLDNISKIAAGQKGSVKAEVVYAAMLLGKPVWIGKESSGIKRSDRRTLKVLDLPQGYRNLMTKYRRQLEELGIRFAAQKELAETAAAFFLHAKEAEPLSNHHSAEQETAELSLVTAEWIHSRAAHLNGVLELSRGTIISPLARDVMREKGIVLQYIDKG